MNCDEVDTLLNAYLDGELAMEQQARIKEHLQECKACMTSLRHLQETSKILQQHTPYFSAPAALRNKIQLTPQASSSRLRNTWRNKRFTSLSMAASLFIAVGLSAVSSYWWLTPDSMQQREQEAISSHIRSMMISNRLTDVASSDRHTVKPWFSGKLDFAPPVNDLTAQGYALVGGRLEYFDKRPAAALVYRHRQHIINVFVTPERVETSSLRMGEHHGFNTCHWTRAGLQHWAVSDLNSTDLQNFCKLLQQVAGEAS